MPPQIKGRATIRTAGIFYIASAVLEVVDYNSAIALLGGVRAGTTAVLYHFVFAALYFLTGIGMWTASPWGYGAFMATTAVYTIDKIQMMLFPKAFYDYLLQQLTVTREILELIPREQFIQYFLLAYIVLLLCWWGFALYIHLRRQYFNKKISI
jgi:hypothetical protein